MKHRHVWVLAAALLLAGPATALAQSTTDYLGFSYPPVRSEWRLRSPYAAQPIIWSIGQINVYSPQRIEYYVEYRDPWGAFHTIALEPIGSKVYLNGLIYRPDGLFSPWRLFPKGTVLFDFDAPEGSAWANGLGLIAVTERDKVVVTGEGTFTNCIQFWVMSWEGSQTVWTFAPGGGLVMFGETDWAFILE
jgi:hypothetical protein